MSALGRLRCLQRLTNNCRIFQHTISKRRLETHLSAVTALRIPQTTSTPAGRRSFASASNEPTEDLLDHVTYERVCSETLCALSDYFEELTEKTDELVGSDVAYDDGVLTVNLGPEHGTYVINRQTPNKQIWLSSPTSGPKRYDFVGTKDAATGKWIYKHTGESMHELLQNELKPILKMHKLQFNQLPYSK